ncbi:MAG TPA: adenylate/guanylate cyclase domain-containing protein [Gemmataceae bacterium]
MSDLIAQGPRPEDNWRRPLPPGSSVVLGRDADAWAVPWEPYLSRRHAELTWRSGRLRVRRLPAAANPIYHGGKHDDIFELPPAGSFVIGHTLFTVAAGRPTPSPGHGGLLLEARTIAHTELERLKFRDAPHRLDVLSKLPDVISSAANDADLFARLGDMLLAGVPRADAVALVEVEMGAIETHGPAGTAPEPAIRLLHWDRRRSGEGAFEPSRRLVIEAVANQAQTILHVWSSPDAPAADALQFTLQGRFDWAFCTPVVGEGCRGWGLYVAGRFAGDPASTVLAPLPANELRDDVKFAELVAEIVGSLRQVQVLRERQGVFRRFFSPGVLHVLSSQNAPQALEPREADVTVLFCDLREFSRKVEEAAGKLLEVLQRVSSALGVMTRNIVENRGAIADFYGDAAMGFWGWPLDDPAKVENACRAALGIRAAFDAVTTHESHPLFGFKVGIGIASGRAVAGGIGTAEQAKVGVFGPVVNLAARLEGMTKPLRVPILLDEPTAELVRSQLPGDAARVRRLAKVRPYGLETPLVVTELVPPAGPESVLTDQHLADYDAALEAFLVGEWVKAYELLHRLPPQDRGKDLLTGFILQYNHTPPPNWDGVIPLTTK